MNLNRKLAPLLLLLSCAAGGAETPVTVRPLADVLIDHEIRAPATVVAANEAVLTAQVTALVEDINADVGATVTSGDVLIGLDDDDARLARDQARASLNALDAQIEQAELRLTRGEELFGKNFISDDELIERRTTLSVLRANRDAQRHAVRAAELQLSRTRIVAPFNATVTARQAQVGSLAMPGTALITLVQTDNREIDADLDPRYAANATTGQNLRFVSQGRSWSLTLARLSPVIENESRIQKGRFRFSGQAAAIGTSGEVVWIDASGLVPVPLIVQRGDRLGVFVADDGVARFEVLPEAQEGRPAPVSLPPETRIVVRGQARLQDGDTLQIDRP